MLEQTEYWVYYYLTAGKDGVSIDPDDLKVSKRNIVTVRNLDTWYQNAIKQGYQLKYFVDEDEAEIDLKQYRRGHKSTVIDEEDNSLELSTQWKNEIHTSPVTPVVSSITNNINLHKETEVVTESTVEATDVKTEWGGKRPGAGRKKGSQGPRGPESQEHKDKRIAKLKETAHKKRELRNAVKNQ